MLPILRLRFDELERQRQALLSQLSAFSPSQLAFRPGERSWSMTDVAQHLVLVEEGILQFLTNKPSRPDTRSMSQRLRFAIFKLLAPLDLRVRVPVPSVIPAGHSTLGELASRWESVRAKYERYLENVTESQLSQLVFKHAFAGPVTIVGTLDVMRLHVLHHRHQLRRIRSVEGFPTIESAVVPAGAGA